MNWFRLNYKKYIIFAVPNGEKRNLLTAIRLKKEGVLAGIPDLCILLSDGKFFFIEMKSVKGRLSKNQKDIIGFIEGLDHKVLIGYGIDDAIKKTVNEINKLIKIGNIK